MLKKPTVLLLLCALCMWAADFWTAKPFTEWNEKEVQKMLSSSPWTGTVSIAGSAGGPGIAESGGATRGGRGGGGGGNRGGSTPSGDGANADPNDSASSFGGGVMTVTLYWQTALPIRQALVKRQYGAEAGTSPEAKAKLERVDQVYVLALMGMPGSTLGSTQGEKKAALLESTTLTVYGKPPVKPTDVQVAAGRGTANVYFVFPKTTSITADDKEMEFVSKFGVAAVKHKFKLKDMVFNGKLEM
jgi:hypothetical protein